MFYITICLFKIIHNNNLLYKPNQAYELVNDNARELGERRTVTLYQTVNSSKNKA